MFQTKLSQTSLGASSYFLTVKSLDGTLQQIIEVTSTSSIVDSLEPGVVYDFSLQSVGPRGDVSVDSSSSAVVQTILIPPVDISVLESNTSFIQFVWPDVKGKFRL